MFILSVACRRTQRTRGWFTRLTSSSQQRRRRSLAGAWCRWASIILSLLLSILLSTLSTSTSLSTLSIISILSTELGQGGRQGDAAGCHQQGPGRPRPGGAEVESGECFCYVFKCWLFKMNNWTSKSRFKYYFTTTAFIRVGLCCFDESSDW